jgi:hypothetical protein
MKKLLIVALVVAFSIGTAVLAKTITYSDVVRAEDANTSGLEAKAASLGLTTEELKAKIAAQAEAFEAKAASLGLTTEELKAKIAQEKGLK